MHQKFELCLKSIEINSSHTAVAILVWIPWVPEKPSIFEQYVLELIFGHQKGLKFFNFSVERQLNWLWVRLEPWYRIWEPININSQQRHYQQDIQKLRRQDNVE